MLSQYLDGELTHTERRALEAHLLDCADCRRALATLSQTIDALHALPAEPRPQLADAVIAALRLQETVNNDLAPRRSDPMAPPGLSVVGGTGGQASRERTMRGTLVRARAVLRYCLRRAQLRLTVPTALLAGAAISLINQGNMIFNGEVTVGMCAICALNFVVPFIALNLGLAIAVGAAKRRRI
jgi:anti-sigma factor RsiW